MTITRIVNANLCPTGRELYAAFRAICAPVEIDTTMVEIAQRIWTTHVGKCKECNHFESNTLEVKDE
jgi:hypothetical protein